LNFINFNYSNEYPIRLFEPPKCCFMKNPFNRKNKTKTVKPEQPKKKPKAKENKQNLSPEQEKVQEPHDLKFEKEKDPHAHLEDYVDKQVLLQKLFISERTLQRWRTMGIVPFIKIGRKLLYYLHDVIAVLKHKKRRNDPALSKKDESRKGKNPPKM
jgi:hypothetical protein